MEIGTITRVEDMPVFRLFYALALDVERTSRGYPKDFGWLRGQKLRSSESVCANMTEGFYSQYSTEYRQSLFRCRREARETQTHLRYASDVAILDKSVSERLLASYEEGIQQLNNLIGSIERKISSRGKARPKDVFVKEDGCQYGDESAFDFTPLTINH
jgi:four helix bundle protein